MRWVREGYTCNILIYNDFLCAARAGRNLRDGLKLLLAVLQDGSRGVAGSLGITLPFEGDADN